MGMLSLIGIPPLAGFAGKLALFTATIDAGLAWVAVAAVVNTVVSVAYYLRVVATMIQGDTHAPVKLLGRWSRVAVAVATSATVLVGIGAVAILEPATTANLLP